jgi:carbon storage regulator CsrA
MLVISRKVGQQIRIGDQITVTILRTQGQTVRVGIEAPREVRVLRAELPPLPLARSTATSPRRSADAAAEWSASECGSVSADSCENRRMPGRDAMNRSRRTQPNHPQRWTVATMRERVQGQTLPQAVSAIGSTYSM